MTFKRLNTLVAGIAAAAVMAGISGIGSAASLVASPLLSYDPSVTAGVSAPTPADQADDAASTPQPVAVAADPKAIDCMAKVILHEAANQPRAGKIAVGQTLVNRVKDGRFGASICAVASQPGQFFRMSSFHPRRASDAWNEASEIAQEVIAGQTEPVAPGAMFFRAAYAPANAFFRSRERVSTVGAHIFYR